MKKTSTISKFRYKDTNFAHESEREFAKILDFYGIGWQYEPRTFPVEWDADGNPIISFTPDFYLPLIPYLYNGSSIKISKPIAYPMCNSNHYDSDHEVLPNNFPSWFTLCFCDNVAQQGKD